MSTSNSTAVDSAAMFLKYPLLLLFLYVFLYSALCESGRLFTSVNGHPWFVVVVVIRVPPIKTSKETFNSIELDSSRDDDG